MLVLSCMHNQSACMVTISMLLLCFARVIQSSCNVVTAVLADKCMPICSQQFMLLP